MDSPSQNFGPTINIFVKLILRCLCAWCSCAIYMQYKYFYNKTKFAKVIKIVKDFYIFIEKIIEEALQSVSKNQLIIHLLFRGFLFHLSYHLSFFWRHMADHLRHFVQILIRNIPWLKNFKIAMLVKSW